MTRTRIARLLLVILLTASLGIAGCGDDDDDSASDGADSPGAAADEDLGEGAIPASLVGTYRFEIPGDAFWIARLDPEGRFVQRLNGRQLDASGRYGVDGEEIRVRDTASGVGTFCQEIGTYQWALQGNRLVMRVVDEPCSGREDLWTSGWEKLP